MAPAAKWHCQLASVRAHITAQPRNLVRAEFSKEGFTEGRGECEAMRSDTTRGTHGVGVGDEPLEKGCHQLDGRLLPPRTLVFI